MSDAQRVEVSAIPLPGDLILQTTPDGIFDRNDLQWSDRRITAGSTEEAYLPEAYIPADRREDFFAGERELLKCPSYSS